MKKKAPGSYGFTTTPSDQYIVRVAKEAKENDRFLIARDKHTFNGTQTLAVLVRQDALPHKREGLSLGGVPLSHKNWGLKVEGTAFRVVQAPVTNAQKAVNIVKTEIQRLKNFLDGRHIRVQVESL